MYPTQVFQVVETLDDALMFKFVSWVRFIVFDEEVDFDPNSKVNLETMIKKQDMAPLSLKCEIKLWHRVKEHALH